jgi:LCP family protein required for cell wall assembly
VPDSPPPQYKVYRSRRRPFAGLGGGELGDLRQRLRRPREPRPPRERQPLSVGRVLKWIAVGVLGWLLLSFVLFILSAQVHKGVSAGAKDSLSGGGTLLTGSNVLLLGSDQRVGESIDKSQTGPSRADTIMVMHVGLGSIRKLSIPRDAYAQIPGHGAQKINAAYAIGGPPLVVKTVENYLDNRLKINHLSEIDFENFPKFIDAMGGITVTAKHRICSPPFDNFWKGLHFHRGQNKLNGTRALGFSRVRKNKCAPSETDIERGERQQEVMSGIFRKVLTVSTFVRLPWVAWKGPQALRTDLHGPGLLALAADAVTGRAGKTVVMEPSCQGCGPGGSLLISEGERRDAVNKLLGR